MRLTILLTSMIAVFFLFAETTEAQERTTDRIWQSPNAAVEQTIGLTEISVTYGRPGVRDRLIFSPDGLVPYDRVWRTGANEATAISFSDDVRIEGEFVEEGVYSLYTIPGEDEWTIIINNKLSWGTEYDESEDVLRVQVQPVESHYMDQMMIYFENVTEDSGELIIHWDHTKVPVLIEPAND